MGRSLPRAIAAAAAAATRSPYGDHAPSFEQGSAAAAAATPNQNDADNVLEARKHDNSAKNAKSGREERGAGRAAGAVGGVVTMDEIIAGNPGRAMEELNMRARLETVREEVEVALKMHASMAKGERTSWLKKVERQNEENSYQVGAYDTYMLRTIIIIIILLLFLPSDNIA